MTAYDFPDEERWVKNAAPQARKKSNIECNRPENRDRKWQFRQPAAGGNFYEIEHSISLFVLSGQAIFIIKYSKIPQNAPKIPAGGGPFKYLRIFGT